MPSNGLDLVCEALIQQNSADNAGWDQLVVKSPSGANLRALSPNNGMTLNPNLFVDYYTRYVDAVYARYASQSLGIDTQAQWGTVRSTPSGASELSFGTDAATGTGLTFPKPTARDIFSCSTGAFTPSSSIEKGALIARLAAGFNRSTLLGEDVTPTGSKDNFYGDTTTNHYARTVHAVNVDGRGYAFPFDDVSSSGGEDQSGAVFDENPAVLTVAVGGGGLGSQGLRTQA